MANKVYPKFKKAALSGVAIDLLTNVIKVVLIDLADYVYNDAHEFLADIPAPARVAISPALISKTISDLADFDSADPTLPAVPASDDVEALAMFIDTGDVGTSRLIYFQDTGITGAPLLPDGNDIKITVNAAGWFRL